MSLEISGFLTSSALKGKFLNQIILKQLSLNSVSRQLWLLFSELEQFNIQNSMNLSKIYLEKHKQLVSEPGITSSPCHIITNYIWQAVSASFNFNNYKIIAATVKSITCMCILKIASFFLNIAKIEILADF